MKINRPRNLFSIFSAAVIVTGAYWGQRILRYSGDIPVTPQTILYMSSHQTWLQNLLNEGGWNFFIQTSGKIQCLTHGGFFSQPTWSPDRKWIAFSSYEDILTKGNRNYNQFFIWRMKTDGAEQRRISPVWLSSQNPVWSPDGQWILFSAHAFNEALYNVSDSLAHAYPDSFRTRSLFLMRPDGSQAKRLGIINDCLRFTLNPSWAPDSRRAVFIGHGCNSSSIQIVDVITEVVYSVLTGEQWQPLAQPNWSPVKDAIAFVSRGNIFSLDLASGMPKQLTSDGQCREPSWSVDGKHLYFVRASQDDGQIWRQDLITGETRQTTFNKGHNVFPVAH